MAVFEDREDERGRRIEVDVALERPASLVPGPAEVRRRRPSWPEVDLLDRVLADVADVEVPRLAVEREAPGVAQTEAHRLPVDRQRIRSQQLREARSRRLPVVLGVSPAPAVPHADVELAVGPELDLPAVVVRERLVHEQQLPCRTEPRSARVGAKLDDARVAAPVGVVDVEAAVLCVVRVKRHREQALLGAVGADSPANVHEQAPLPLLEHEDPARLLDDVDPGRLRRRRRQRRRAGRSRGRRGRCSAAGAPCLPRRPPAGRLTAVRVLASEQRLA